MSRPRARLTKPGSEGLEIVRLGRAEWRISDARVDGPGSARLLGYVERLLRHRYEVVWMTDPIRWGYVETFDEAIAAFVDSSRFGGITATERDRNVRARTTREVLLWVR